DMPDDFFDQCVAERKVARYVRGHKRIEWTKGKGERNEGLDLLVYNLAMAHYLGINRYHEADWERARQALAQAGLFDPPPPKTLQQGDAVAEPDDEANSDTEQGSTPAAPPPAPRPPPPLPAPPRSAPPPQRRSSSSGYLKRR
ncbi:terminase gpA endonuclease subunit, partial [Pseudomonas asplenii]|uniref:terminase gpA endonuclease subunit n=1 Tax=Pseudomonas asplenii TaxID=53407 RepID=UPI001F4D231A